MNTKKLSANTRRWFDEIVETYHFESAETELLYRAAELRDSAMDAQITLETSGRYYLNRFGEPRQHPAIRVQQQSIDLMARILKQLGLADSKGADNGEAHEK